MEVMSLLVLRVNGKAEADLRPVKGATKVAWAGEARLTEAAAADDTMDEAIPFVASKLCFTKTLAHNNLWSVREAFSFAASPCIYTSISLCFRLV